MDGDSWGSGRGLKHYELFFPDGTPPPEAQAKHFLKIAETEPGVIAVHCKAGLGRTGTLILMWAMKHFKWTAKEAIGYLRFARPGSIMQGVTDRRFRGLT